MKNHRLGENIHKIYSKQTTGIQNVCVCVGCEANLTIGIIWGHLLYAWHSVCMYICACVCVYTTQ